MHFSRFTAGALLALAASLGLGSSAPAQAIAEAPTYSRLRMGADDWHARGGFRGYGQGLGGYGHGYFQPYLSPVITGSWYARPYPYHFDYFRGRWSGSAPMSAECPCAEEPLDAATPAPEPAGL